MSGDVFDTGSPRPEAERAVFRFFKRVGQAGIPTVVIAGNHDSAARIEAWGALAELVDVRAVARPCPADRGGLQTIVTRSGEKALVAAVPFASPGDLVSALEVAESDTSSKQRYADGMRAIVANVTAGFRHDAVNLLMLHTHLEGAAFSGSERTVHLGDEWAATPQALPPNAHYIALGHIHKPQRVLAAPSPACYAGSPLQMDFGESGEEKSWVLVDARKGQPARCERVPYRGGRPLEKIRATLVDLEHRAPEIDARCFLWVTVPIPSPDPDLNARVRRLLPNALKVEAELPEAASAPLAVRPARTAPAAELYAAYHAATHGSDPRPELLAAFEDLRATAEDLA
jgi:exonuclease SbcD